MPPPMTFLCQRKTRPCEALVPCADIPAVHPTEQASSPFSALAQTLSLTLVPTNRLSVALLMQSLVLCNQVLSELRRVHFTRSQGTCSNQVSKPPPPLPFSPVSNNTSITVHLCSWVIHCWRRTRSKIKLRDKSGNQRGISGTKVGSFPFLLLSNQLRYNPVMIFNNRPFLLTLSPFLAHNHRK